METIISWFRSGLIFSVIASAVIMLSPNKSYEKHISLVIGMLFILVMLHPVMEFFSIDGEVYRSTIEGFLAIGGNEQLSTGDLQLYRHSINMQVMSALLDAGYMVDEVDSSLNRDGEVEEIIIFTNQSICNTQAIEDYLKHAFGKELIITYEIK